MITRQHLQRAVGGDQGVEAQVELLATNEHGVLDIPLHHVSLGLVRVGVMLGVRVGIRFGVRVRARARL